MPQVVDIDGDGINDIVGGAYLGEIAYYKGTKNNGFEARKIIKQKDEKGGTFIVVTLGDINNDGLLDAFVGGNKGLAVMLNIGTKQEPIFDFRKPLLGVNGKQILSQDYNEHQLESLARNLNIGAPDKKTSLHFIDWDGDGIEDILSTGSYYRNNCPVVGFHKGVIVNGEHRFENRIALFEAKNGEKTIPGNTLYLHVCDVNNDKKLDILIGFTSAYDLSANEISKPYTYFNKYAPRGDKNLKNKGFISVMYGLGKHK